MLKVQILAIIILLYCLFSPPPLKYILFPILYKIYIYIIYDLLFFLSYQIYFYIKSIQNELVDKINERDYHLLKRNTFKSHKWG